MNPPPAEVKAVELAHTGAEAPWLAMGIMLLLLAFVTRPVSRSRRRRSGLGAAGTSGSPQTVILH